MTSQRIDFTKMRKGSRPYGRKIEVCPKCGRKAQATHYPHKATWKGKVYQRAHSRYIHTAAMRVEYGFRIWSESEECIVDDQPKSPAPLYTPPTALVVFLKAFDWQRETLLEVVKS